MKLFDIDACTKAPPAERELLQHLDLAVRFALSRLAQGEAARAAPGAAETMSATLLLSIAADLALATASFDSPDEEDFIEAARDAAAFAQKRHPHSRTRLAA